MDTTGWHRSSKSFSNGNCVEFRVSGCVQVRDSKDPDGPVLTFSPKAWAAFTGRIKGDPVRLRGLLVN